MLIVLRKMVKKCPLVGAFGELVHMLAQDMAVSAPAAWSILNWANDKCAWTIVFLKL